jgi:hypothetical protein
VGFVLWDFVLGFCISDVGIGAGWVDGCDFIASERERERERERE